MRGRWRIVAVAGVLLLAAVGGGLWALHKHRQAAYMAALCGQASKSEENHSLASLKPPRLLALGDSYSAGQGLGAGTTAAWPVLLTSAVHRSLYLDALPSTGFTTRGYCSGYPARFGERLTAAELNAVNPQIVVVQGGVNDALDGAPHGVGSAADVLLDRLSHVAQVIVVGPPDAGAADSIALGTVDEQLRASVIAHGRDYISLLDQRVPLQSDKIHPTPAGQRLIAKLIEQQIDARAAAPQAAK